MSYLRIVNFTKQGRKFAVDIHSIVGLEDDGMGSILITLVHTEPTSVNKIHIDEDFETAYARINELEPWEETSDIS